MKETMNSRTNKLKGCLIVFWLSVFAMILISAIDGNPQQPQDTATIKTVRQDTIKKDTTLVQKLNKREIREQQKELEYEEWQQRSQQIDENMKKMAEQSALMDSLLSPPDTTVIIR